MYLPTRITELGSDDGWIWRKEVEPDIFIIDKTYGGIQSIWADHYAGIARTNTIVNRVTVFEGFSNDGIKNSLLGQAKFLRAYYYFNLFRLFGGVPLIVEEVVTRADARILRSAIRWRGIGYHLQHQQYVLTTRLRWVSSHTAYGRLP